MPGLRSAELTLVHAAVVSLRGEALLAEERALLQWRCPAGVILFARNCRDRDQVRDLVAAIRVAAADPCLPVLVDQEGGRVMRLRPPSWPALPSAARIGALAASSLAAGCQAAELQGRIIGGMLADLGIGVACTPVLDVARDITTPAIGDRSFGADPECVAACGRALADGLRAAGVLPVIKHIPGHGAATADSHARLPAVDLPCERLRAIDFLPFRRCRDLPAAMTAHVLYPAVDPAQPATTSRRVIDQIIRGEIGFAGLLLSDDLSMGALEGPIAARASRALEAGCDLALYCAGVVEETRAVLAAAPPILETVLAPLRAAPVPLAGSVEAQEILLGELNELLGAG